MSLCPNCRTRRPRIARPGGVCHRCANATIPTPLRTAGPVLAHADTGTAASVWSDLRPPRTAEEAVSLLRLAHEELRASSGTQVTLTTAGGTARFVIDIWPGHASSTDESAVGEAIDKHGTRHQIDTGSAVRLPGHGWWGRERQRTAAVFQDELTRAWRTHPTARRLRLLRDLADQATYYQVDALTVENGPFGEEHTYEDKVADLEEDQYLIASTLRHLSVLDAFAAGTNEARIAESLVNDWAGTTAALLGLVRTIAS